MDGISVVPPAPFVPRHRHTLAILVWVIIVSGVIMGVYLALERGVIPQLGFAHVFTKQAPTYVSPVYELPSTLSLLPRAAKQVMIPGHPDKGVVDFAEDGSMTYYLVFDRATRSSNLYALDKRDSKHTLTALTSSPTLKDSLSYDASSGVFVYSAAVVKDLNDRTQQVDWMVTTYSKVGGKEQELGKGTRPQVLSGGAVIARDGTSLVSLALAPGVAPTTLLDAAPGIPFAVSSAKRELALYNSAAKTIDYYSLKTSGQASFIRSERFSHTPSALTYAGGMLLAVSNINTTSIFSSGIWSVHLNRKEVPTPVSIKVYE